MRVTDGYRGRDPVDERRTCIARLVVTPANDNGGECCTQTTAIVTRTHRRCHHHCDYAVVHGAIGQRQTAGGAQPVDVGTQAGHGVSPVQPAAAASVVVVGRAVQPKRRAPPAVTAPPSQPSGVAPPAARRFRRPARAARPPVHGEGGQRQQHRFERRRRAAGHARETAREQTGRVKKVGIEKRREG